MSEKDPLMVRPSLFICHLSWHWQSWPPLHTNTCAHTHSPKKPHGACRESNCSHLLSLAAWEETISAQFWQYALCFPLSLTLSLCHLQLDLSLLPLLISPSAGLSVCFFRPLNASLSHNVSILPPYYFCLPLSPASFLCASNALVVMRVVCGKQLSTLSGIIRLIPCKYTPWWRCTNVLKGSHHQTNHNDWGQI